MGGGPSQIGMLEGVAAPVESRIFTIPDTEYSVVFSFAGQRHLLGAPYGGSRDVLVETRFELDVVGFEIILGAPKFQVIGSDR